MKNLILKFRALAGKMMPPPVYRPTGFVKLAVLSIILLAYACHKDHPTPLPEHTQTAAKPNYPISLFEAMAHFSSVQSTATNSLANTDFIDLDPRWSEAYLSQSQSGKEIVVVPLADTTLRALNQGRADAKLLFSKNGPDAIVAEILVYAADSAYLAGKSTGPEFGDFTGQYLFFDIGYNFKYGIWVEDGALNGYVLTIDLENTSGVSNSRDDSDPVEDCIDHVISEFITYQCDATEQVFWDCHAMIISTIAICHTLGGGGGGGGGGSGTGGGGYGTGGGTGGGGNNNENPYSPFWDVFTGSLPMGIFVQSPSLLPPGFDTTLVRQFIDINRIFNFLPQQLIDLSNNPAYIQVLYNIFAPWVNVPITPENQANAPNFALVKPVTDFAIKHKLTAQQFSALLLNGALFGQISNYILPPPATEADKTEFVKLHLERMLDPGDPEYATLNHQAGYPAIGTLEWANTLDRNEVGPIDDFMKLKPAEKLLAIQYAPAALKIDKNRAIARSKQRAFWGNNPNVTWLGKGDAFLHTYFQAINTQRVGPYITKLFADAHETEHPPILHLETEMDLFNNNVGIQLGINNFNVDIHEMADIVHAAVIAGGCKYLSPVDHQASPAYDDCYDETNSPHCLNGILPTTIMKWTDQ